MGGRGKPGKGTVEGTQVSARPWWRLAAQRPRLVDALVRLVLRLGGPDWRCWGNLGDGWETSSIDFDQREEKCGELFVHGRVWSIRSS